MKSKPQCFASGLGFTWLPAVRSLAMAALLALAATASAQTNGTWIGADGATWNTTDTNWTGVTVPSTPWASPGTSANATFNATSGSASVSGTVFANTITYSPVGGNFLIANGTITLAGTNATINNFDPSGTLTLSSTVAGSAGLISRGAGTLVLAGNNTYTGTTTIRGGPLVLDYSGLSNTADPLSTGAVTLDMGTLMLKGKSSGSTSETISTLNMGANLGTANTLRLDANGGSGIALTTSTFRMNTTDANTQNINLIDLSSSAANSITVGALGSGTVVTNGVLMGNSRANLVVRDSSGYGFATLSGATSGTLGRLSTGTTLNATLSSSTANYRLEMAGTVTRTANLDFSTLTFDSTAGEVTLAMGSNNLAPSGNGRGILITGPNDVSITGSGRLEGTGSTWFHNYSTGTFTYGLSTSLTVSASLMFGGSGLTVWTGNSTKTSGSDNLYIEGGIFRPTAAQNWTTGFGVLTGGVWVSSGAVLEVGADLNGATAGDLTNTVGNNAGAGNIRFWGNSGVSAFGANRTVNFGNATIQLTWGSTSFLTDAGGTGDGNYVFKLSSNRSDSTVTVQNAIALGSLNRTVEVADGSAATDAILSGVLSGSGGLVKSGAGTLTLSGANSYTGATSINAGTLSTSAADRISNSSAVTVASGATFLLGGNETVGSIAGAGNYSIAEFTLTAGGDNTSTTVSGNITGANGALTKSGSGTLTLSGASANTYTGTTTVSSGTLTLNKNTNVVAVGGDLVLNGSSKLLYGASKNEQIANAASITINGTQSVFNGSTWNSTSGTIQSNITETVASLTIRDGQFNTGTTSNWTITGAGVFDGSSGDARFAAFSGTSISFNSLSLTTMTGTTIGTSEDSFVLGGNQPNVTTLTVGSGGLTLNGSILSMSLGAVAGGNGSRLIFDGNITTTGSSASFIGSYSGTNGTTDIRLSSTAGTITRTITTGSGADLTISVAITNGNATAGGIIKDGLGTLTLNRTNTYTGATTVAGGTLLLSGNGTLGTSTISISGGTLDMGGKSLTNTFGSLTGGTLSNGTLTNNGGNYDLQSGTVSAILAGTNGVNKTGSGTVRLTGQNTYQGATTVQNGTLEIASTGAIGNTSRIDVNNSGSILLVTVGDTLNNTAAINLNDGQMSLMGNFSETFGNLTSNGSSRIDLASFSGVLRFGGVGSWGANTQLAILNWNSGTQNIVFTDNTNLSSYLNQISFYSNSGDLIGTASMQNYTGFGAGTEIIAVPEPETYIIVMVFLLGFGIHQLRLSRQGEGLLSRLIFLRSIAKRRLLGGSAPGLTQISNTEGL